jgi:hypothetical protein
MIYKTQYRKLNIEQHEPYKKTEGELRCSGSVKRSCSTCGNRCVTLVTAPVINHEWVKDWEVPTTNEPYPWSFVLDG